MEGKQLQEYTTPKEQVSNSKAYHKFGEKEYQKRNYPRNEEFENMTPEEKAEREQKKAERLE